MDIFAETNAGVKINIEVQLASQKYLEKRFLYYWTNMYSVYQLNRGEEYSVLKKGISIIFLNFDFLPQPDYHSLYGIYNLTPGHRLTDDF
jgi:predicted transposase/invertase (TIGR01784 family)